MNSQDMNWWTRTIRRVFFQRLQDIQHGELIFREGDQTTTLGSRSEYCDLSVTINVLDPQFYWSCAAGGSIGAAEAYGDGLWNTDDLPGAIRIFALNREALESMESGLAALMRPFLKGFSWLHRNTKHGSRRNIAAHYDLGNEFFREFLDDTMMYSCAIFENENTSLEAASLAKIDHVCQKLQLRSGDHLLEIGTGWGALAVHAAQHYGCRVTTTTISQEQAQLAAERIQRAGLSQQISLLQKDYRELTGTYDKLVSIEMIEAVGHQYFDTFFERCSALLKPNGMMLLQAITIAEQEYDRARRSTDFIQRHIFPGSCLPSNRAMLDCITRKTDFRVFHLEDLTPHYAQTLREWRRRFLRRQDRIRSLGFDDRFLRLWDFYFAYCEGGFEERVIGDIQLMLTKPMCRAKQPLSTAPVVLEGGRRQTAHRSRRTA